MTRDDLIASSRTLRKPSNKALQEFSTQRELLVAAVNTAMSQRPDIDKLVGITGKLMSENNNRNFSLFMESLFQEYIPEVLVDTALWVFRAYRSHGFAPIYWPANLDTWREQLQQNLSAPAFAELAPFYTWLITHVPVFTTLTDRSADDNPAPPPHTGH